MTVDGRALRFGSYLGGEGLDGAQAVAEDAGGSLFVTGYTYSSDFPTANPVQSSLGGGGRDAFVAKISNPSIGPDEQRCHCGLSQPATNNPVNTRTGNYWTSATDLHVLTPGPAISWSRVYASQAITDTTGALSPGWQYPYAAHIITPTTEAGRVIVLSGRNNRERFTVTDTSYDPFPGVSSTLVRADGVFTQTLRDQQQLVFDAGSGNLVAMRDSLGRRINLTYSGTPARLTQIADAGDSSRYLALSYTGAGQIQTVGDGTRSITYTYTLGDLSGAQDVMGRTTSYSYTNHLLTQITNPLGQALARTDRTVYHADRTVASTIQNDKHGVFDPTHPDEDVITTYGYDGLGRRIWTRDALGRYDVSHYNSQGQVAWSARNLTPLQLDGQGQPIFQSYAPAQPDANVATLYGYDGLGRTTLVTQTGILTGTFDPATLQFSGATTRVTKTEYDALSRPITTTLDYGGLNVQTLTYYDGNGNVIWQRDVLGRWTRTEYDALSRPITTTVNYEDGDPLTGARDADILTVTHYDAAGRLDRQIDNAVDTVFSATEPITDRVTLSAYDTFGRVISSTLNYASGEAGTELTRVRLTAYDPATMRVQGQRDALGRWVSQQYDLLGRVTATIQNCRESGGTAVASGCAAFDPDTPDRNVPAETHYDALGRVFETEDALGHVTHTDYDGLGRAVATIQNYVWGGSVLTDTNVTTRRTYDVLGHTLVMTDALGHASASGFNGLGQTVVVTDTLGRVTRMGYDGSGALRWTKRNDGQLTVYQLDGLGRTVATIVNYQDGVVGTNEPSDEDLLTRSSYDAAGRRVRTIDPAGRVTVFAYDNQDRLIAVTENAVSGTCTQAPCNVVTQYQYDRAGNRTAIVDANGHTRRFSYDAADQPAAATDALNQVTSWEYDAQGRLTTQHDPRGTANDLSYSYDGLDRLTQRSATNLGTIAATYDALGRRMSLSDATGTTSFGYDGLGRMTRVQAPNTGHVGYDYDAAGQRTGLRYPDGASVQYGYWPDGQLHTVTQGTTTLASYGYDSAGRLQQLARANGATSTYAYDGADRLADLATVVDTTPISDFAYQTDRLGQRTGVTETLALTTTAVVPVVDDLNDFGIMVEHSTNLGFDTSTASSFDGDAARLRRDTTGAAWAVWHLEGMDAFSAISYHWSGEAVGDFTFFASPDNSSYTPITPTVTTTAGDWIRVEDDLRLPEGTNYVKVVFPTTSAQYWNPQLSQVAYRRPASVVPRAISYSYDGLLRLTAAAESPGITYAYSYDDAGNRTGVWLNGTRVLTQTFNAANQVDGFSYDAAGNLTNDGTATYGYDALSRMTQRGSTTYTYTGDGALVYDGTTRYTQDLAAPLSQVLQTTQGSTTTNYLYGRDRLASIAGSTKTWYVGDALGSVRLTLDDAGAPLGVVSYDPWGVVESGNVPTFGFTGELQDTATGLVNLRARWYATGQGRFGMRDPFAGNAEQPYSLHPYQ